VTRIILAAGVGEDAGAMPSWRYFMRRRLRRLVARRPLVRGGGTHNMPGLDAILCGSVAVPRDGRRCWKGEGYSDLEFAILRELGYPPVPVATTVHDLQVVEWMPRDPTDQLLSVIATISSNLKDP
jgi:5-formyltetrahydrofolate cyclo-ligase